MTFTVESKGKDHHYCPEPGFWKRRKLGLKEGAVIRCDECGTERRLTYDVRYGWSWDPVYVGANLNRLPNRKLKSPGQTGRTL